MVETLLIIGIFANVLKGADLVLLPKQQAWIQEKCETLTLWLDYTKPLVWYARLKNRRTKVVVIITSALLYFGLDTYVSISSLRGAAIYWLLGRVLVISAFAWQLLDRTRSEHPLIRYILNGQGFTFILLRPLLIIAIGAAINLVFSITGVALYSFYSTDQLIALIICLYSALLILGILVTLNIPIISIEMLAVLSTIILLISIGLLISEGILKILRGVAWRIIEYSK